MRYWHALLFAVLLAPGWAFAGKPDGDLPKPDPKGYWRVMTQDDATTTSKCLDSRKTPLCAVENFRACNLRVEAELCRQPGQTDDVLTSPRFPDDWYKYRVVSSGHFKKGDPRLDDRDHEMPWVPGDIWIILDERHCSRTYCAKPVRSELYYVPVRYIVHKDTDGWQVVYAFQLHWRQ